MAQAKGNEYFITNSMLSLTIPQGCFMLLGLEASSLAVLSSQRVQWREAETGKHVADLIKSRTGLFCPQLIGWQDLSHMTTHTCQEGSNRVGMKLRRLCSKPRGRVAIQSSLQPLLPCPMATELTEWQTFSRGLPRHLASLFCLLPSLWKCLCADPQLFFVVLTLCVFALNFASGISLYVCSFVDVTSVSSFPRAGAFCGCLITIPVWRVEHSTDSEAGQKHNGQLGNGYLILRGSSFLKLWRYLNIPTLCLWDETSCDLTLGPGYCHLFYSLTHNTYLFSIDKMGVKSASCLYSWRRRGWADCLKGENYLSWCVLYMQDDSQTSFNEQICTSHSPLPRPCCMKGWRVQYL